MNDKKLFIGTSGFYYPHWQGVFYPRGLIRAKYFEYFSTCFHKDVSLLEDFLQILPTGYRCAFEFRHGSWYTEQVYTLLEEKNAALCLHDFARQPTPLMDPADFVYLRLHGPDGHYGGCYSDEQLQAWAKNIAKFLERGKTVFCYFNNDGEGNAVVNDRKLSDLLAA